MVPVQYVWVIPFGRKHHYRRICCSNWPTEAPTYPSPNPHGSSITLYPTEFQVTTKCNLAQCQFCSFSFAEWKTNDITHYKRQKTGVCPDKKIKDTTKTKIQQRQDTKRWQENNDIDNETSWFFHVRHLKIQFLINRSNELSLW